MDINTVMDDYITSGEIPGDLAPILTENQEVLLDKTKKFLSTLVEYRELMMMYACAMKEIKTRFEILDTEFSVRYQRNPISSINTRLKCTNSIVEKLMKNNYSLSLESIEKYVNDVAGIRIICCYVDDIYGIADALLKQDDITLITCKDYIANPKPNGYRSLHLIVCVPVFFSGCKKEVKVEVQIRTIAMDFWASLEHQIKYKQELDNQEEIITQLKECSETIAKTDKKMLEIRKQIEAGTDVPTEDDILLDKLTKLDIQFG